MPTPYVGELTTIRDAVAAGTLAAPDVVQAALDQVAALNPPLNAVVALRAEEALAEADRLQQQVAGGGRLGPLAGVPVLVKDLEDVAGMVTTQGSRLLAGQAPATADSTVVHRLRQAGAIIIGKTNLPEFATEGFTANLLYGVTGNPWQPALSPGGSSGGSAAAVASGMVPLATATDGGGSIRIPAAFCGLVGLKPTAGVVGRWPAPDWIDYSTEGPFATTVADLRLLLGLEAGPVPGDPTSFRRSGRADASPLTRAFAVPRFGPHGPLPDDVQELFAAAVSAYGEAFRVEVEWVDPGRLIGDANPDDDWFTVATAEHVARLGRQWVLDGLPQMHPAARGFMEWGITVGIDAYLAARRRRYDYVRALDELLEDDAVLLSPTIAATGWLADGRMSEADEPGMMPAEVFNTAFQNITGHPSLSVPAGVAATSVPFGLQVTGPRYADDRLLDVGERWEQSRPWPRVAPGYRTFGEVLGLPVG